MKSKMDDAQLRLSAVTPEMSQLERERTATKIADGMTADEIQYQEERLARLESRARRDLLVIQSQRMILARAKEFQTR